MVLNHGHILLSFSLGSLHQSNLFLSDMRVVVVVLVHSLSGRGIDSIYEDLEIEDVTPVDVEFDLWKLKRKFVVLSTDNLSERCHWHPEIDSVSVLLVENDADSSVITTFVCHHKHQQCVLLRSHVFNELLFVSFDNVGIFLATIADRRSDWLSFIVFLIFKFGFFLDLVA